MKTSFYYAIDFNNKPAQSLELIMSVEKPHSNSMLYFQNALCMEIGYGENPKNGHLLPNNVYEYREDKLICCY
jgi:hypothetical protein